MLPFLTTGRAWLVEEVSQGGFVLSHVNPKGVKDTILPTDDQGDPLPMVMSYVLSYGLPGDTIIVPNGHGTNRVWMINKPVWE